MPPRKRGQRAGVINYLKDIASKVRVVRVEGVRVGGQWRLREWGLGEWACGS